MSYYQVLESAKLTPWPVISASFIHRGYSLQLRFLIELFIECQREIVWHFVPLNVQDRELITKVRFVSFFGGDFVRSHFHRPKNAQAAPLWLNCLLVCHGQMFKLQHQWTLICLYLRRHWQFRCYWINCWATNLQALMLSFFQALNFRLMFLILRLG